MKLKALTLRNFRGVGERELRIDCAPITMLFGPNNAGKSTVLRALLLAKEIFCNPHFDLNAVPGLGPGRDFGAFVDYAHGPSPHNLDKIISLGLEMELGDDGLPVCGDELQYETWPYEHRSELTAILAGIRYVGLDVKIRSLAGRPQVTELSISFNKEPFAALEFDRVGQTDDRQGSISFSDAAFFLAPDDRRQLAEEYKKFAAEISDTPDDKVDEKLEKLEDLREKVQGKTPSLLQAFIEPDQTAVYLGAPEALILPPDLRGPCRFYWKNSELPPFDRFLTLEKADFEDKNIDSESLIYPRGLISSLLLSPVALARDLFGKFLYLGPLRSIPQRNWSSQTLPAANSWADGSAAWSALPEATDEQFAALNRLLAGSDFLNTGYRLRRKRLYDLDSSLHGALHDIDDFDEERMPSLRKFLEQIPKNMVALCQEATGAEIEPADMGAGIAQVLPVLAATILAKPSSLVLMEQPALHIHPKLQVALGDVFIAAIKKINPPIFFLETHSEHLLLRLLRRIRQAHEGAPESSFILKPDQLSINWIGQEDNITYARRLTLDDDGTFNIPWPEGFFDERGEELFG